MTQTTCQHSGQPVTDDRIMRDGDGRWVCPCGAARVPTRDGRYPRHKTASEAVRASTAPYVGWPDRPEYA